MTRLERLATAKLSSLLGPFTSREENETNELECSNTIGSKYSSLFGKLVSNEEYKANKVEFYI